MSNLSNFLNENIGLQGPEGKQGPKGDPGTAATIEIGSVVAVPSNLNPEVSNSGTETAAVLDFKIPMGRDGKQGIQGETGEPATITVGTTTSIPYGESPMVSNSGTETNAVLDFKIPEGKQGIQGEPGYFKLGGAQTMKICVPVGSTYPYGDEYNKVELEEIPLTVGLNQSFSFTSPFANTPGIVEVLIKSDDGFWCKQTPQYVGNSDTRGITAVCNGDGQVHVTTGTTSLLQSIKGVVSPSSEGTSSSTEVVFLVYAASSKTPDDYQAEETVIGTWFGKTLYRYCIRKAYNSHNLTLELPSGIVEVVSIRSIILRSDDQYIPTPIYQYDSNYDIYGVYKSGNKWYIGITDYGEYEKGYHTVIIEYVKDNIVSTSRANSISANSINMPTIGFKSV